MRSPPHVDFRCLCCGHYWSVSLEWEPDDERPRRGRYEFPPEGNLCPKCGKEGLEMDDS